MERQGGSKDSWVGVRSGMLRMGQDAEPRRSMGAAMWLRETWTEAQSTALGACGHQ